MGAKTQLQEQPLALGVIAPPLTSATAPRLHTDSSALQPTSQQLHTRLFASTMCGSLSSITNWSALLRLSMALDDNSRNEWKQMVG